MGFCHARHSATANRRGHYVTELVHLFIKSESSRERLCGTGSLAAAELAAQVWLMFMAQK